MFLWVHLRFNDSPKDHIYPSSSKLVFLSMEHDLTAQVGTIAGLFASISTGQSLITTPRTYAKRVKRQHQRFQLWTANNQALASGQDLELDEPDNEQILRDYVANGLSELAAHLTHVSDIVDGRRSPYEEQVRRLGKTDTLTGDPDASLSEDEPVAEIEARLNCVADCIDSLYSVAFTAEKLQTPPPLYDRGREKPLPIQLKSRNIEQTQDIAGALSNIHNISAEEAGKRCSLVLTAIQYLQSGSRRTVREVSTVVDHIAATEVEWLTETNLYGAWCSEARGEVICSRWLWYPAVQYDTFTQNFIPYMSREGYEVLHVDGRDQFIQDQLRERPSSDEESRAVAAVFLTLTARLLGLTGYTIPKHGDQILRVILDAMVEALEGDRDKIQPRSLISNLFVAYLFRKVVNLRSKGDIVILFDHIDSWEESDLTMLRNLIQDVMDSQRGPSLVQVRTFIVIESCIKAEIAFKGAAKVDKSTRYYECISSLSYRPMNLRRSLIVTADLEQSHWLWSNAAYQAWNHSVSGLLWIKGKPGSGKSVIAKAIQHSLAKNNEISSNIASWFYSARDGMVSHVAMARAILLQLLKQDKACFEAIKEEYYVMRSSRHRWSWARLKAALSKIKIAAADIGSIIIVLDGLDESAIESTDSGPSRADTMELIMDLAADLKFIILSRPVYDIRQRFRRFNNGWQIVMEKENQPDITQAIDRGLETLSKILNSTDDEPDVDPFEGRQIRRSASGTSHATTSQSERIAVYGSAESHFQRMENAQQKELIRMKSFMAQHAEGVILWVTAVFSSLKTSITSNPSILLRDLRQELENLPTEVEELYENIITNLKHSTNTAVEFGRRALAWVNVATSKQPFKIRELLEAMRIPRAIDDEFDEDPLEQVQIPGMRSPEAFIAHIQTYCGMFIEIAPAERDSRKNSAARSQNTHFSDHVQLIHQSAKGFLETSSAAGAFRLSFDEAQQLVTDECSRYLRLALPIHPYPYVPFNDNDTLPDMNGILHYLEAKALLPYVLFNMPKLSRIIPKRYRFMFEKAASPTFKSPDQTQPESADENTPSTYEVILTERHARAVRDYFKAACERGLPTAVENLFNLASLRFGPTQWYWYREEPSIIHGALLVAIQYKLHAQCLKLAWYVGQRGLDLLDLTVDLVEDQGKQSELIKEALKTNDLEICSYIIGFRNDTERFALSRYLEANRPRSSPIGDIPSPSGQVSNLEIQNQAIIAAVDTIIAFWATPPKLLSSPAQGNMASAESSVPFHPQRSALEAPFGANAPNVYGDSAYGANVHFGANTYGYGPNEFGANLELESYTEQQKAMFMGQMKMTGDIWKSSKRDWLSQEEIQTNIARVSVAHGGRNANRLRIKQTDLEGHLLIGRESRSTGILKPAGMQTQTTEQEFADIMNDAAWKTASSASSDKIW